MEGESEYLETDLRKKLFKHLKHQGLDVEALDPGTSDIERKPYYSFYFTATPHMVDSIGCLKAKGKNFEYVHIIRRG